MTAWDFLNANTGAFSVVFGIGGILFVLWRAAVFYVRAINVKEAYEITKREYEAEKNENKNLNEELGQFKAVRVIDGMLFVVHDPYPQNPICPSCYADGKVIRMAGYGTLNALNKPEIGYTCIKCKCVIIGTNAEKFANAIKQARSDLIAGNKDQPSPAP